MSFSSAISTYKKASARTGFVHVEDTTASILRDCFKQFGIEVVPLGENAAERLNKEKFDACVVTLDDRAESVLERARSSPSNKRMVVFGVCSSVAAAIRYSKYGLNVLLEKPVERQTALRAVRATHLLIINEFRRYVRIPIVMNLNAISGMQRISGSTVEVSGGGMSFLYKGKLSQGEEVQVNFDLPNKSDIKVTGVVCWVVPSEGLAGLRFEPPDQPGREIVRHWIDNYLGID